MPAPNVEETIMKEMFVQFGDVRGAAKEAWFDLAKAELQNKTPFTSLGSKTSATTSISKVFDPDAVAGEDSKTMLGTKAEKLGCQPPTVDSIDSLKKSSVFHSHFFGVYAPGESQEPSDVTLQEN